MRRAGGDAGRAVGVTIDELRRTLVEQQQRVRSIGRHL